MLISLVAFAGLVSAKSYFDYVFLFLGDSTSAPGTGYVDCINGSIHGSQVINHAKSGYSTQIYLDDIKLQQQVAEEVKLARSQGKTVVCSQQFGNIDEKHDARFMNHSKFVENTITIHTQLDKVCSLAVITTPFMRRAFAPNGTILRNLDEYSNYAIEAATKSHATLIDLHKLSARKLESWGPKRALQYALGNSTSHVNYKGCKEYAREWAQLFRKA